MMVRRDQAVRRNKCRRSRAYLRARKPNFFQPFGRRFESITFLPLPERRIVERPHALVAKRCLRAGEKTKKNENNVNSFHNGLYSGIDLRRRLSRSFSVYPDYHDLEFSVFLPK